MQFHPAPKPNPYRRAPFAPFTPPSSRGDKYDGSFDIAILVNRKIGGSFGPASLPGLIADWRFNEGSGAFVKNRANALDPTSNNLLLGPEGAFSSAAPSPVWGTTGVWTVTDGGFTAPDGSSTASRVTAASGNCFLQRNLYSLPAGTYTLSVYAKSNDGTDQTIRLQWNATLTSKTVLNASGWAQYSITFSTAAATLTQVLILNDGASATNLLLWGAKLEAGNGSAYPVNKGDITLFQSASPATWSAAGLTMSGTVTNQHGEANWAGPGLSFTQATLYALVQQTGTPASVGAICGQPGNTAKLSLSSRFTSAHPYLRGEFGGQSLDSTLCLPKGAYHVVAVTCDGTTLRLYCNDLEVASAAYSGSGVNGLTRFLLGNINGIGPLLGVTSYASLYSTGHTAVQVRQMSAYLRSIGAARSLTVEPGTTAVFYEGDSITINTSVNFDQGYQALVMAALSPLQGRDFAVGGSTLAFAVPRQPSILACLHSRLSKAIISVFLGANDLVGVIDPTTFLAAYKAYCDTFRANGMKVVICTVLARANGLGGSATIDETVRATVNTEFRNPANIGVHWDAVSDFASDATMGVFAYTADATNCGDGIHPTAAGHVKLAPYNQAAVQSLVS